MQNSALHLCVFQQLLFSLHSKMLKDTLFIFLRKRDKFLLLGVGLVFKAFENVFQFMM